VAPEDSADDIRRRMAELRNDLSCDVREVGRSARAMADPRYYMKRFPWASMAIAAAIGYLLIPKKKQVISPDPEMLAELVRKNQVKVDTSKASKDSQGMLKSLLVMGLTWAAKTGTNYIAHQLMNAQTKKAAEAPASEAAPNSPIEEPWRAKG
jgi:hypothetical protein